MAEADSEFWMAYSKREGSWRGAWRETALPVFGPERWTRTHWRDRDYFVGLRKDGGFALSSRAYHMLGMPAAIEILACFSQWLLALRKIDPGQVTAWPVIHDPEQEWPYQVSIGRDLITQLRIRPRKDMLVYDLILIGDLLVFGERFKGLRHIARRKDPLMVSVYANGQIGIYPASHEALGRPEAVQVLYDDEDQRLALKPSVIGGTASYPLRKGTAASVLVANVEPELARRLGLGREARTFEAELDSGVLVWSLAQEEVSE